MHSTNAHNNWMGLPGAIAHMAPVKKHFWIINKHSQKYHSLSYCRYKSPYLLSNSGDASFFRFKYKIKNVPSGRPTKYKAKLKIAKGTYSAWTPSKHFFEKSASSKRPILGPKSTQRNIWNVRVANFGYNSCTITTTKLWAASVLAFCTFFQPFCFPWQHFNTTHARKTDVMKSGGVRICSKNLLMKGTASWQEPTARTDMISKLTTAPVPCEYVAKSDGHAILYVTVRALKICNQEIIMESIPVNLVVLVSSTCSCDLMVFFKATSATKNNKSATPMRPRIPIHNGEPPSHSMHSPSYNTWVEEHATHKGPEYPFSHWSSVVQSMSRGTTLHDVCSGSLIVGGQHRCRASSFNASSEKASPQSTSSFVKLLGIQKPGLAWMCIR